MESTPIRISAKPGTRRGLKRMVCALKRLKWSMTADMMICPATEQQVVTALPIREMQTPVRPTTTIAMVPLRDSGKRAFRIAGSRCWNRAR